jgi:hypothetical protein
VSLNLPLVFVLGVSSVLLFGWRWEGCGDCRRGGQVRDVSLHIGPDLRLPKYTS